MTDASAGLSAALADRYRIEREIGAGGMATVYLAEDLKHHRKVAIKVLRPELTAAVGADRFLREIETTANLRHPHILPLFDSGQAVVPPLRVAERGTGGEVFLYYVMPYVEGESLRDRLNRDKQLPLDDALRITGEVAGALSYAHERGVIHRDIKPENILLERGSAIVADFGIARAVTSAGGENLTQTGMAIGTPAYMSTEQASGDVVDHRSDMYSLASVLYEMLAGEPPYTGATAQALIVKRMIDPVPSIRRIRESVTQQVDATISRALAKAPADRFASMAAFVEALVTDRGTSATAATAKTVAGIVILPFVNSSPDPENEYFSDGLTEELIADLARVRSLRVISRTSSMQLKGTTKGIRAIGAELGVRYVLEGSVRKAGNALRITAQLIDAQGDAQLWSEKYNGTMDDIFDVQERVSRAIVEALNVTLSPQEEVGLTDRPIANVRAFELYLQARQEITRYSVERGMALLNAAIEIEGLTPPLQSLAAWAKVVKVRSGMAHNPRQELEEAEAAAQLLLIQAPAAPYGHAILGMVGYERGQLAEGVRHFRAALDRAPNDADALLHLGVCYIGAGQNDAAAETAKRFMACDPLSPVAWMLAGIPTWFTGHAADGVPSNRKSVELDPESIIGRWSLAYNLALVGQLDEAMTHAQAMAAKAPDMPYTVQILALVEALSGRNERALERLANVAGLDGHHKFHLAESYAMAGATDRALDLLEEAVNQGFHPYPYIAEHCPFLAPLRGTPRFAGIAARAQRLTAEFRP